MQGVWKVIKIRKVKMRDLDEVVELYFEFLSYTNKFGRFVYKKRPKIDRKKLKRDLKNIIKTNPRRMFLVAEDSEKLLGFIQAEILSPKESKTNKKVIEIVDIYSKQKRKEIGRKLFKEIEKWAGINKTEFIQWEFVYGNKLAEKFCVKNKFKYFKIKMLKPLK
ncbi:MAG: GNAT family N-acetyltransferase [archaeon]